MVRSYSGSLQVITYIRKPKRRTLPLAVVDDIEIWKDWVPAGESISLESSPSMLQEN